MHQRGSDASLVNIFPMATLTKNREGREMVEMGFLLDSGAIAFSDGDLVITDLKILTRALTYAKSLDALVVGHIQEPTSSPYHPGQRPRWLYSGRLRRSRQP